MCNICGQFNCASWCPNNYDAGVFTCESCGEGIGNVDKCFEINGKHYHKRCLINNFCKEELIEIFCGESETA